MADMPETPELDRQKAVRDSGAAGHVQEFIDWMESNGFAILRRCTDPIHERDLYCGNCSGTGYTGPETNYEMLMQRHFGIDGNLIEAERRALLEHLRLVQT